MKSVVFDSSSVISLSLNSLLEIVEELKKDFGGDFVIPESVKKELVDTPLNSKKFKLEAIRLSSMLGNTFKLVKDRSAEPVAKNLQELANACFTAHGKPIKLVDLGEMEGLAVAKSLGAPYIVDERTTRLLVENPMNLKKIFERKFNTRIDVNKEALKKFQKECTGIEILRSSELMLVAYEKGLFDELKNKHVRGNVDRAILEAVLWGLRLRGCSISTEEINEVLKLEGF